MRPVVKIRCREDRPDNLPLPAYGTEGAAGLDLAAMEAVEIPVGGRAMVRTGLEIELPAGHEGQVRPRSGLAWRHGVTVLNAPGTIDEDYRGELKVLLINHGHETYRIAAGDRIAQLVVAPVRQVAVEATLVLSGSDRGGNGFGHTGR
ncbi:MAG: dUTP diphosphatase [Deltaproteobacteria bacterium]|nr:dUTP diphosphatase [Deltaproteobacteria bacterium]